MADKSRLASAAELLDELAGVGIAVRKEVAEIAETMLEWRRWLHQNAELCFQEVKTAAFIEARLREIDGVTDIQTGLATTGILALIRGTRETTSDRQYILCRADMDGLPIAETSGLPFASTTGTSHACGHDGHMTMLLAAARVIASRRDEFSGVLVLCFQPAEEGGAGARVMIEQGALEGELSKVSEVYAIHLWNALALGTVGATAGPNMAASDRWYVDVHGRGGHGACPHETVDPIVVASSIVLALQTVVSRNTDPLQSAVVSVGQIHGGQALNAIPSDCRLAGTARSLKTEVQDANIAHMQRLVTRTAEAYGATASLEYIKGYPVTESTEAEAEHVRQAAVKIVGTERVVRNPPVMGAEDFSFFLQQRPGCFFMVGSSPFKDSKTIIPHHREDFRIHEASLFIGASVWLELMFHRLALN